MKLDKKKMLLVSFMLFSLFFGAGNLIFPPLLGQASGENMFVAMLGFINTAVVLPVLGVVVVAKFDGLDKLSQHDGTKFGIVFTVLIYVSIGPFLGIPRAASVPFEMAFAPYLPDGSNVTHWMGIYSLIFFILALLLALNPTKLIDRLGHVLTPTLLILIIFLFISFLFFGEVNISKPSQDYITYPYLKGFTEGYNTMDAIAALNFGLVISTTLQSLNITNKKDIMYNTTKAGVFAGIILTAVYFILAYMGMASSGVYELFDNGAITLRNIVYQIYGPFGSVLLAGIFTLACLTTCVGLINSISQYFSSLFKKITYKKWVFIITGFSFLVCNLGLNTILSISVPILNAIYPVSIMFIILGLTHKLWKNNRYVYPLTIITTALISIINVIDHDHSILFLKNYLPLYQAGYGWAILASIAIFFSVILNWSISKIKRS